MLCGYRFVSPLAAALLALCASCSPFAKVSEAPDAGHSSAQPDGGGPPRDAGTDERVDGGTASHEDEDAGPAPCVSSSWPVRPHIVGNSGGFDFLTAVRRVDMGDTLVQGKPGYLTVGFDLDGVCTGPGQPNGCTPPKGARSQVDGPGGVDNAVGSELFLGNQRGLGFASRDTSSTSESGLLTTLIAVRGYNGTDIDNQVEVSFYPGTRVSELGGPAEQPEWKGSDEWNVFNTHLLDAEVTPDGGPEPPVTDLRAADYHAKYFDEHAFVTDGTLVAHFPELLTIVGHFARVTIVAKLEKSEQGWKLTDGTFAGRIQVDELLAPIRHQLEDGPDGGVPVCTNASTYQERKDRMCGLADLSYAGFDDASALCDAASWGWKFDAEPALFGRVVTTALIPDDNQCGDHDPALDHCARE